MFDLTTRLLVAYGLIALMVLAVAAAALWLRHNSSRRRRLRQKTHDAEQYRLRQEAAAATDAERARS